MSRYTAPFTAEEVAALAAWQACGWVHPFTCAQSHGDPSRPLTPRRDGWVCLICGYTQNWCHDFMLNGAPPDPIGQFRTALAGSEP
jgi:hypothetical protein